jgi:hypothetical protein
MTKGENRAFKRRAMRRIANRSLVGGYVKMLGKLVRYGWGDGRPGRIRAEGKVE